MDDYQIDDPAVWRQLRAAHMERRAERTLPPIALQLGLCSDETFERLCFIIAWTARYGRQSIAYLSSLPINELMLWNRQFKEILKAETSQDD